jgi:hypothetical protein
LSLELSRVPLTAPVARARLENRPERSLWSNLCAGLERLADAPVVVLALLLLVNAVVLPYRGLFHDARLYAVQLRDRLEPGSMADDLYMRYGSQDRYSAFSAVMLPLARAVGLETAFFLAYLASKALFFWALVRLVFALVPERLPALASLVYLAMAPLPFGGNEVFHLNESFLTPRILSCALVLFALERALAGRMLVSLGLCLPALSLHPLMGFGGLLAIVTWWALGRFSRRAFAGLVVAAFLLGVVVVAVEPLGRRVFGQMDEEWFGVVMTLCFFTDPVAWSVGDWTRIALAVGLVLAFACTSDRQGARLPVALLLVAAAGFAGTLAAVQGRYALLNQASPYRAIWLTELLAVPLGFRACWLLAREPGAWPPLAAVLLAALLTTDWSRRLFFPGALLCFAVLPVCVVGVRGLGRVAARADWGRRAALWTLGAAGGLLLLANLTPLVALAVVESRFDLDISLFGVLTGSGEFLFKLPLLILALALAALVGRAIRSGRRIAFALALAALTYQGTLAALDSSPTFQVRHSARFPHVWQVACFLKEKAVERQRPPCVYWGTDLREIWFVGEARSYLNPVQLSGCAFNRGTALEGRRRSRLTRPFEGLLLSRPDHGLEPWWHEAHLRFFAHPGANPPTEHDLFALCADRQVDFLVLEVPFEGLYEASTGRLFVYDCSRLRTRYLQAGTALPVGEKGISMKATPPKAGGNDGRQPANE